MKKYEAMAGDSISNTCKTMEGMATEHNESVQAEFNGVTITAEVGMPAGDIEQKWSDEMHRRAVAYAASPEGVAAKRRQEKARRYRKESTKAGIAAFDVTNEAKWAKWRKSNEDDGYGEACLRYAARWAKQMDAKIAGGAKVEEIAEATSHEANTEGITGFMYGAAVSMLAECWRHGEALRRWHNVKTQVGEEGEKANESGGVLNPAIVNIG